MLVAEFDILLKEFLITSLKRLNILVQLTIFIFGNGLFSFVSFQKIFKLRNCHLQLINLFNLFHDFIVELPNHVERFLC